MFTLTVSRADVTSEVAEVLRNGLGPQYNVAPGERITRNPFGHPHPDQPNAISVGKGSNAVIRAEVNIIGCSGHAQLRIHAGGLAGQLVLNTFGLAPKIRGVLREASGLKAT